MSRKRLTSFKGKRVYLSGPMEFASAEGIRWRMNYQRKLEALGAKCVVPGEEEKHIRGDNVMNELKLRDLHLYVDIMRDFIDQDLQFVEDVDIILIRWEGEQSSGTVSEALHAYLHNKPIFLVTRQPLVRVPGWLLSFPDAIFRDLIDVINYINSGETNASYTRFRPSETARKRHRG